MLNASAKRPIDRLVPNKRPRLTTPTWVCPSLRYFTYQTHAFFFCYPPALTTQQYQEFAFLRGLFHSFSTIINPFPSTDDASTQTDTIPEPMSLEDALRARAEKAELDEDPSSSTPITTSVLSAYIPPKNAPLPVVKATKSTRAYKKDRANGSTASASRKRAAAAAAADDDDDFGVNSSDGAFHGRNVRQPRGGHPDAHASISASTAPRLRTRAAAQSASASASHSSSPFTTQPLPPFNSTATGAATPEDAPYLPAANQSNERSASGTPSEGPLVSAERTNGHPPDLPHGRTIYSQRPE